MISLLFAVDHEAAGVRRALSDAESFRISELTCIVGCYAKQAISLGFIGMGKRSASEQTEAFLRYFHPRAVILAGYAGALDPSLSRGEVVVAQNYSTTSQLKLPPGLKSGVLVTAEKVVAGRPEREALREISGAQMVDMETAAVEAEVKQAQLPLLVLRGISDGLEDELPQGALAAAYDQTRQGPTPLRLLTYLGGHPSEIFPLVRFVSGLTPVRQALTRVLLEIIRLNPRPA